jgi:hypothetical protein
VYIWLILQKVKNKLGKKPKPSTAHTVTDFRAKSIVLPEQSILQDKVGSSFTFLY